MEDFRRTSRRRDSGRSRDAKAKSIKENWLTKDYFFGPVSPATRDGQEMVVALVFFFFFLLINVW